MNLNTAAAALTIPAEIAAISAALQQHRGNRITALDSLLPPPYTVNSISRLSGGSVCITLQQLTQYVCLLTRVVVDSDCRVANAALLPDEITADITNLLIAAAIIFR